jgi:iron only hydrogenase large subunit-like protein
MRSSSARLFATSGGVVEALLRTLHVNLTGKELENLKISEMRNSNNRKEIKLQIGKHTLGFAAVSGLANAKKLLEELKSGRNDLHFVEVMACESGCLNGGGQPIGSGDKELKARQKTIFELDDKETIRVSHKNPQVIELYQKHFKKPLSEETYPLLHTTYCKRDVML